MPAKEARRRQALTEVERLVTEFEEWSGGPGRSNLSQIAALSTEVLGAAAILRDFLENKLDLSGTTGEVYAACAKTEEQLLWLWRVWYYFRDKFDQRDDERFAGIIAAANEVVWSCYKPFFRTLVSGRVPEPAPLPYIEADFSPSALRRDQKEVLARRGADYALVRDAFGKLPIPILKVPITCINNPWALVLIGHETGHVIQPMIQAGFADTFAETVAGAASEEDAEDWRNWSREIFADWYSVLTMGQWAVWAMGQFEQTSRAQMIERRRLYPSRLVRLALLTEMAHAYGLPSRAMMQEAGIEFAAQPGEPEELGRDLACVPAVAKAICELEVLKELVAPMQFAKEKYTMTRYREPAGEVEEWRNYLLDGKARPVNTNVRSARLAAAGVLHAWADLTMWPEEEPAEEELETFRAQALATIAAAAEPSVRAASKKLATRKPPGRTLLDAFEPGAGEG